MGNRARGGGPGRGPTRAGKAQKMSNDSSLGIASSLP